MSLLARVRLAQVGFGIWLLGSAGIFIDGSPDDFQRFGAVGIAIAVLSVFVALNDSSDKARNLLADEICDLVMRQRIVVETITNRKGQQFFDEVLFGNKTSLEGKGLLEGDSPEVKLSNSLSKLQLKDRLMIRPLEFQISIFATLQWGYGDMVHCWLNGNGWTSC